MVGRMVLDFTNEKIVDDCNLRNFQVEWCVIVIQRRRRKAGWGFKDTKGKHLQKNRLSRKGYYAAETHPGIYGHTYKGLGPLFCPLKCLRYLDHSRFPVNNT